MAWNGIRENGELGDGRERLRCADSRVLLEGGRELVQASEYLERGGQEWQAVCRNRGRAARYELYYNVYCIIFAAN